MRSVIFISLSIVLLILSRSIALDSEKLRRVVWHHDYNTIMHSVNYSPALFDRFERKFGYYPKFYQSLDSLRIQFFDQDKSLTRKQQKELNALCDSLNVDCQHRTILMKLSACLSSFDLPPHSVYFDPRRDIMVAQFEESRDSVEMTISLFNKINYDERVQVQYYLDGVPIDSSRLMTFEGTPNQITAEIYNRVTGQTKHYSMQ